MMCSLSWKSRWRRVVCFAGALVVLGAPSDAAEPSTTGTNVVIIVTDDQVSSSLSHMPEVQRLLVREGTSFSNFLINDPICCPSRVTILLGQYRHNHSLERGKFGCTFAFYSEGMHHRSLGKLVQDAGYRTGYIGKHLNSHLAYMRIRGAGAKANEMFAGWDDYHINVKQQKYYGLMLHENGGLRRLPKETHQTDELARLATAFIADSVLVSAPFFLFVAPDAPHEPVVPAARHLEALQDLAAPRPPSFDHRGPAAQAGLPAASPLGKKSVSEIDARYRLHVLGLLAVDELVRDVVGKLAELGQLENTFIFFMSDNGLHFGEHRIPSGKGTPFEEAVRVPLVVRGPGVAKNRELRQIVGNVDILPTVLDLLGRTPAEDVDGRSLLPLFGPEAASVPWRNAMVLESRHTKRNQGVPMFGAVRTNRYKWIEYDGGARALYDLERDPHELESVEHKAPEVAAALAHWLEDLATCHGAACREVENQRRVPPQMSR